MFAVCVTFEIAPDGMTAFLPAMRRQAENSLRLELDCHVFDICVADGGAVFLYELYTDPEAFQRHLHSAHFRDFDAEVAPLILSKSVQTYATVIRS